MKTLEVIKLRLAEVIEQSELTQTYIAKQLGISQQQISCYQHGKKLPSLDTFADLCAVLDIDPAYILGIENKIRK